MKKKLLFLSFAFLFCLITLTGCSISFDVGGGKTVTNTEPLTIEAGATATEIAEEYLSATVTVMVEDNAGDSISFGSGVAVYAGGYIATNYHVIDSAINSNYFHLEVYLNGETTGYTAEILWYNQNLDLAIIRSDYYNIPFVKMADRWIDSTDNLRVLEQVITIGTPLDFGLQNTVSLGYISSTENRYATSDTNLYEDLIQHSAPISNGNSGGPLFDMKGNLIGLNTLGASDKTSNGQQVDANSIYFAVPIYPIMEIIENVANGTYETPKFGISGYDQFQAASMGISSFTESGFKITSVESTGASNGKLQVGDIVTKVTCEDGKTFVIEERNDFIYAILHSSVGDTVTVEYKRGNSTSSTTITLN